MDFEELISGIEEATQKLVLDIEDAWHELEDDLKSTVHVRFLRAGAPAFCRHEGAHVYGIVIGGDQIAALNEDGVPEAVGIADFLERYEADQLFVAAHGQISTGDHDTAKRARMAIGGESFDNSAAFVRSCLNDPDYDGLRKAIEHKQGSFEWRALEVEKDAAGPQDSAGAEEE